MAVRQYLPLCCVRTALIVSEEERNYATRFGPWFLESFRSFLLLLLALPGLIDTLLHNRQLEGLIVYDVATEILDIEIFSQHSITDLNLWHYIYCFVQSGKAFTVKGNKHTRTRTHTHTHTYTQTQELNLKQLGN